MKKNKPFHVVILCRVVHIAKRENAIVNRLNKTKVERVVDHEEERIERVKRENAVKRAAAAAKVHFHDNKYTFIQF